MTTISVIMPTYNRECLLHQAISSVLSQTYQNFELIVIDDGSTDGTSRYLSNVTDPKIAVIKQENMGVAEARNRGLSRAKGEFIAFLDSDDLWFPGMLEAATSYLRKHKKFQWVCGGWMIFNDCQEAFSNNGIFFPSRLQTIANKDLTKALLIKSIFPIHSIVIRRECIEKVGGFNTNLEKFEDWEFWIRVAANGFKLSFIDSPFAKWRHHRNVRRSDSTNTFEKTFTNFFNTVYLNPFIKKKYGYLRTHAEIFLLLRYASYFENKGLSHHKTRCFKRAESIFTEIHNDKEILMTYNELLSKFKEENDFFKKIKSKMPFLFAQRQIADKAWLDYQASQKKISKLHKIKTISRLGVSHPIWMTKKIINKIIKGIVFLLSKIKEKYQNEIISIKIALYKLLNYKKAKIFLYTDSRGYQIGNENYKSDPFHFYPGKLLKNYNVDIFLCPEKHTTIIDFIRTLESQNQEYDVVIAHVGIVDFSPRPKSVALNQIYNQKKEYYDKIFGKEAIQSYLKGDLEIEYEGEKTINMFSLQMTQKFLIPYLKKIPNLIFIGCNNFVNGWEGNYFRCRPKNISIVEEYSKVICRELTNCIDISDWSDNEIKKYTWDNLHLTEEGGKILHDKLLEQIHKLKLKYSSIIN